MSSSNLLSVSLHLSGLNIFPAVLKSLLTSTYKAGTHKNRGASLANEKVTAYEAVKYTLEKSEDQRCQQAMHS